MSGQQVPASPHERAARPSDSAAVISAAIIDLACRADETCEDGE